MFSCCCCFIYADFVFPKVATQMHDHTNRSLCNVITDCFIRKPGCSRKDGHHHRPPRSSIQGQSRCKIIINHQKQKQNIIRIKIKCQFRLFAEGLHTIFMLDDCQNSTYLSRPGTITAMHWLVHASA